ncbi:hypothetical protein RQP46_009141 [Phenoliferia psychrophenolica]
MAETYLELLPVYNGGFIVLAYIVATIGAWATLEMLLMRVEGQGRWNFFLLVGAGLSFGSTATFGMHFVGNQAVRLQYPATLDPQPDPLHLSYDIGYTLLSLVVACLSMIIAFSFIGLRIGGGSSSSRQRGGASAIGEKSGEETTFQILDGESGLKAYPSAGGAAGTEDEDDGGDFGMHPASVSARGVVKILAAGLICGGGIAAMHYVGQVSINSVPKVTNTPWIVFLSVLIAVIAVSGGLYLLFVVLRPRLAHSWWKKGGVAMILGLATSLMHFVALLGTHYFTVAGASAPPAGSGATSKQLIIALVCVVAPLCCFTLLLIAIVGQAQVVRNMAQRHRIIVAVALFDQKGLILVQPNGLLPSAEISPAMDERDAETPRKTSFASIWALLISKDRLSLDSMNKKLAKGDPAFIACLKKSWSWRFKAQTLLPPPPTATSVFSTASSTAPILGLDASRGGSTGATELLESPDDDIGKAVASFEQAAQDLSHRLSGAPDQPRVNGVLYDGILKTGHFEVVSKTSGDRFTVSQGQMLVLTRRVKSNTEREAFIARGFTFAEPGDVSKVTADTLAVPPTRVFEFFKDVFQFTRYGVVRRIEPAKIYALPGAGLQVVVDDKMHHSLPLAELGYLAEQPAEQRRSHTASSSAALPFVALNSVAQGAQDLGGRSLLQLVEAQCEADLVPAAQRNAVAGPPSDATLLRAQIVSSLMPLLERTIAPELIDNLLRRLILVPTLIPLLDNPTPSSAPTTRESFLVCLKAVVPASVELPGKLNWTSFSLFKAQAECVAHDSNRRLLKIEASASRQALLDQGMSLPPALAESSFGGSLIDGEDNSTSEDGVVRRPASAQPSFPPMRPVALSAYDPDWVVSLLKPSAPVQQAWDWVESSRKSRETTDDSF